MRRDGRIAGKAIDEWIACEDDWNEFGRERDRQRKQRRNAERWNIQGWH